MIFCSVPGHEIAGHVIAVGDQVKKFKVGDKVGVGCMVDSCRQCNSCHGGEEQYCERGMVLTYGGRYHHPHCAEFNESGGNPTQGGYSKHIVVAESYVVSIPDSLNFSRVAPLLCAGITTYSPLRHFGLKAGHRFAVAGLGGLGHMGVKFARALGAHVTVISRGTSKKDSALKDLGANDYLDSTDAAAMAAAMSSFDFILNTIAAEHNINAYLMLLKRDGKMVMVGAPPNPMQLAAFPLLLGRRTLAGSSIGGIKETQEMLNFCGEHNITCDVETIRADQINDAYVRTLKGDVKYRFVIDTSTM